MYTSFSRSRSRFRCVCLRSVLSLIKTKNVRLSAANPVHLEYQLHVLCQMSVMNLRENKVKEVNVMKVDVPNLNPQRKREKGGKESQYLFHMYLVNSLTIKENTSRNREAAKEDTLMRREIMDCFKESSRSTAQTIENMSERTGSQDIRTAHENFRTGSQNVRTAR